MIGRFVGVSILRDFTADSTGELAILVVPNWVTIDFRVLLLFQFILKIKTLLPAALGECFLAQKKIITRLSDFSSQIKNPALPS